MNDAKATPPKTQVSQTDEDLLHIIFILRFINFMDNAAEWIALNDLGLELCVFDTQENKNEALFEKNVKQYKVKGYDVKFSLNPQDTKKCSIAYFLTSYKTPIARKFTTSSFNPNALTISHQNNFSKNAGIVEFYKYRGRIRFYINQSFALDAKQNYSAKLLELSGRK